MALIKRRLRPKTMEMASRHGHKSVQWVGAAGFKKETQGLRGVTEKVWNDRGIRRRVTSVRPAFFGKDTIKIEKVYDADGKFMRKTKRRIQL